MNEKLKELSKQAADETSTAKFSHMSFQERFSELILKEVLNISLEMKENYLFQQKNTMDFSEKNIFAEGQVALGRLEKELQKRFCIKNLDKLDNEDV